MSVYQELSKPFPKELLQSVEKGGRALTYIPAAEVVARLNDVLGFDKWSYQVIDRWSAGERQTDAGVFPTVVMAHVRLTIDDQQHMGPTAIRDGIGGQQVKFTKNNSGPVDLGDEWKGAVSDALKKAAQAAGVALDLARSDAAMALANQHQPIDMEAFSRYCMSEGVDPLDAIAHAALPGNELTNADKPVLVESVKALAAK